MLKGFLKSGFAAGFASGLIGLYLRLLDATSQKKILHRERFDAALAEGDGVILAFWHGRLLLTPFVRKETSAPVWMLVSRHRDGDIIVNGARGFDVDFIRGSAANPKKPEKAKGGVGAVAEILDALRNGDIVGVTPDGPRGPRASVQSGMIRLAQLSGAPIVPAGISATRGKFMSSWDRFLLAFPFASMIYVAGEPIRVAADATAPALETARKNVEDALIELTADADRRAGRTEHGAKR